MFPSFSIYAVEFYTFPCLNQENSHSQMFESGSFLGLQRNSYIEVSAEDIGVRQLKNCGLRLICGRVMVLGVRICKSGSPEILVKRW